MATLPIYNITPFTMLDYPHKTACIIWFAGCNMRCLYCYNPDIVLGKGKLSYQDALKFITTRKNLLDGVVLSGGECTLHKEIDFFAEEIKKNNMLVKIDTNGSNPKVISNLINKGLLDYVALDFKATPAKFNDITGTDLFSKFEKTLDILLSCSIPFEIRTTIHSDLIDQTTFKEMKQFLNEKKYGGTYFIQNFINDVPTLGCIGNSCELTAINELGENSMRVTFRN